MKFALLFFLLLMQDPHEGQPPKGACDLKKDSVKVVGGVTYACMKPAPAGLHFTQQDPHEGQPESCNNNHKTPETHRCACHKATMCPKDRPAGEDSKCQTYCRKEACKCQDPCTS